MKNQIKIAHVHLETPLILSEEYAQLLIIENPTEFYNVVNTLNSAFDGEECDFIFSCEDKIISPEKTGVMVLNPFQFDLNDKKIINLLYKKLETISLNYVVEKFNKLSSQTISFIEELSYNVPFALDYNEPQPVDYLKAFNVKFEKTYDDLLEKIICYMNALIELKNCEFFVFVNLKSVLNDEKLLSLYAHCRSEQVGLLLIENSKQRTLLFCEKAVIITEDLCEILENYSDL